MKVALGILSTLVFVALVIAIRMVTVYALPPLGRGAASLHGAEVAGSDLFVLYSVDAFSQDAEIRVFDLASGEPKARQLLIGWNGLRYHLIGPRAHSQELWLHSRDLGLHTRDAHSGEVVLHEADLIAKDPGLAAGFEDNRVYYRIDAATKDLCLETKDRFVHRLDASTLASKQLAPTDPGCIAPRSGRTTESMVELSPDRWLEFVGSPRSQIGLRSAGKTRTPDADSYISPEWLCGGACPIRFGSGPDADAAMVHLVENGARRAISRVSVVDGKARWTTALNGPAARDIRGAWIANDRLVLLTVGEIAAMDVESGRRAYSTRF
jgi:hypothetical protein